MRRALDRFCNGVELVAGILLAACTLLVVSSVIGRYFFTHPLPDAFDISRLLIGACITWGFASVGYRGGHIAVDLFWETLPPGGKRAVDIFAWGTLLVFAILLAYMGWHRVTSAFRSHEATFDLRIPVWPFLALIWLGCLASVGTIGYRLFHLREGTGTLVIEDSAE